MYMKKGDFFPIKRAEGKILGDMSPLKSLTS